MNLFDRLEAGEFPIGQSKEQDQESVGQFKEALRLELDFEPGKPWEVFWQKAWDNGHANGLFSVLGYAEDLEQFLSDYEAAAES